jgi:hypothetical protein
MRINRRSPHHHFWHLPFILSLAIIPSAVWLTPSSSALAWQKTDVTGAWDLRVEAPEGTATPTMDLVQEGEKITGTYAGQMGKARLEGTLQDDRIQFSLTLKFKDRNYPIAYTGTVKGNAMTGTAQFGDTGTGRWTAQRSQK